MGPVTRGSAEATVLIAAVAVSLSACAATVTGTGTGGSTAGAGASSSGPSGFPTDTPSVSLTPAPTTVTQTQPATPTPSPSLSVVSVPPPKTCPPATCTKVASASAGDGYQVVLRSNPPYNGGAGLSALELVHNGVPVFWATREGETPNTITCSPEPAKRCIVVNYTGAHAAVGRLWKIEESTLVATAEVQTDTPTLQAADLNGDGYVDLRGAQNTYEPDYATGKVFWQTWRSDGAKLKSTGCTPPAATLPAPPPALLTGVCL